HDHDDHHHEHHHHADEMFTSWGRETAKRYSEEDIKNILSSLEDENKFGMVLRAKGIVESKDADSAWIHFDYTPGELDIRRGAAAPTGMLCVIGHDLKESEVEQLFGLK
ncbi:MAG: GTP-binding protein, partial [Bacillota bacterium]|nr:GTP-binding protein [Bacillota bacterium]